MSILRAGFDVKTYKKPPHKKYSFPARDDLSINAFVTMVMMEERDTCLIRYREGGGRQKSQKKSFFQDHRHAGCCGGVLQPDRVREPVRPHRGVQRRRRPPRPRAPPLPQERGLPLQELYAPRRSQIFGGGDQRRDLPGLHCLLLQGGVAILLLDCCHAW